MVLVVAPVGSLVERGGARRGNQELFVVGGGGGVGLLREVVVVVATKKKGLLLLVEEDFIILVAFSHDACGGRNGGSSRRTEGGGFAVEDASGLLGGRHGLAVQPYLGGRQELHELRHERFVHMPALQQHLSDHPGLAVDVHVRVGPAGRQREKAF